MHQLRKLETRGPLHCRLLSSFTERTEHHEGNGFLHATQHHDRLMRGKSNEKSTGCRSSWTCCTLHVNALVCALSCFGSEMSNLLLAAWLCLCQSSKDLITTFICYMHLYAACPAAHQNVYPNFASDFFLARLGKRCHARPLPDWKIYYCLCWFLPN